MKSKTSVILLCVLVLSALAGCGQSREEAAREKQRLELERQTLLDAEKANKAISEKNRQRFGKKAPTLDLGVPVEKKSEPAPASAPAPATKS